MRAAAEAVLHSILLLWLYFHADNRMRFPL